MSNAAGYGKLALTMKEAVKMETKEIIQALRTKRGLSQNELAEQVHVTRQAVSR